MNKKILIIILVAAVLLFCVGLIVAGVLLIPRIINNLPGPNNAGECGIASCHGLDIICSTNPPQMCTEQYQIGDNCRQYAKCQKSGSTCSLTPSTEFTQCKSCVEKCINNYNATDQISDQFSCAEKCSLVSTPVITNTSSIANPSATYCTSLGYSSEGEKCVFSPTQSCNAWDFYRGKCLKENSFCEQSGYKLSNVNETTSTSQYEYALCTFNDKSVCAEEEFYKGNCKIGQCRDWKVEQGGCVK